MRPTLAFDVYGTLIDTNGVIAELRKYFGDKAESVSQTWRSKQLEYSFRRALMQNYVNFSTCTSQALDYTCSMYGASLSSDQKEALLAIYRFLPTFDDVEDGLVRLRAAGFRLFAFSNGEKEALDILLGNAGIRDFFIDTVTVDDIRAFKPSPATYCHFMRKAEATGEKAWMVSSNPFDVIGAMSAGMKAVWVQRSSELIFDPWEITPTQTVTSLHDLANRMESLN